MRSDNLKRHEKICQPQNYSGSLQGYNHQAVTETKASEANQQTFLSFPDNVKPASNPKVSEFIDAIVNNGEPSVSSPKPFTIPPAPKKMPQANS